MSDNSINYEDTTQTGKTVYAVLRSITGQWANGTTLESFNSAHWGSYAVVMMEVAGTGYFSVIAPSLFSGSYVVGIRVESTPGTPALSDTHLGGFQAYWDGTGWHRGPGYVDLTVPVTLSSTGLDQISIVAPTGPAGTFTQMVVMLYRRFFKKSTLSRSGPTLGNGVLQTFADDNVTPITSQTVTDAGSYQTQSSSV